MLFRSVLQNFTRVTRKKLRDGVPLKKLQAATYLRKDFIKGFILCKLGNFSEQLFPRATFSECLCFGSCPCGALSKQQVFCSPNKYAHLRTL